MNKDLILLLAIAIFCSIAIKILSHSSKKEMKRRQQNRRYYKRIKEDKELRKRLAAARNKSNIKKIYQNLSENEKTRITLPPKTKDKSEKDVFDGYFKHLKNQQLKKPKKWSLDLINKIEWRRFEILCMDYWKIKGHEIIETKTGNDGGVDFYIKSKSGSIAAAVQCKSWKRKAGVKITRELLGVVSAENLPKGIVICTSGHTDEAIKFAHKTKKITLITGSQLLKVIKKLPEEKQEELLRKTTQGDYLTPTCARCNIKMVKRVNPKTFNTFWGCINYPRCKSIIIESKAK